MDFSVARGWGGNTYDLILKNDFSPVKLGHSRYANVITPATITAPTNTFQAAHFLALGLYLLKMKPLNKIPKDVNANPTDPVQKLFSNKINISKKKTIVKIHHPHSKYSPVIRLAKDAD